MGKSTKDGRWKSGSMPTVRIDRKNKQARVFIGGKQHHLGRVMLKSFMHLSEKRRNLFFDCHFLGCAFRIINWKAVFFTVNHSSLRVSDKARWR